MDKEHHSKIVWIAGVMVLIIAAVLGLIAVFGRVKNPSPPGGRDVQTVQEIIKSTTAPKDSSITEPAVQKLIQNTTAPKSSKPSSDSARQALIKSTTGR